LQQQQGAKAYSYTLYDEIGRIKEVGELLSTLEPTTYKNRSQIKYSDHTTYVTSTSSYRHQVTTTKYDRTDRGYNGFTATYLRNRVAYTTYQQTPSSQVQESHYSYDVHGNVKSMLQVIRGDGEELTKRIDYEYDLVSGKVNKVTYQKDNSDQFIHRYQYDGDNRIIQVATSTDDIVYTQEATYQYYAHGPLARINYGELNVETQDFAYTIQGWIKQVQGQVFAYALGYNNTDYSPIGAANQLATPIATGKSLYNGNIATMTSRSKAIANNTDWTQQFTYDQLNRIKTSTTAGGNPYATSYSYDANGNILNLTRKDNAGGNIDNLTYNYENKAAGYQRNTNRLRSVDDAVAATAQSDDIEDQQEDNYAYDATGNLVYDRSEEIAKIEWTVSGKVLKVIRTTTSTKPNLEFTYDASGNRIAKKVIQPNGNYSTTFYVRDASGNVMAVYKTSGTTNLSLEEQHIYGSSRLGIFKKNKTRKATTRALGERRYELTDHLGNVRVVMSDYKRTAVIVLSATDYYPFGMVARTYTSPEEYRYGFNGQERDDEVLGEGNFYDLGMRCYDTRLGRMFSIDPRSVEYPWQTTYAYHRNSPISILDFLGGGDTDDKQKVTAYVNPNVEKNRKALQKVNTQYQNTRQMYIDYYKSIGKINDNSTNEEIEAVFSQSNKQELDRLNSLSAKYQNQLNEAITIQNQWNKLDRDIEDVVHNFNQQRNLTGSSRLDPNLVKALMFSETEMGAGADYQKLVEMIHNNPAYNDYRYQLNLGRVTDANMYNQVVKDFKINVNWQTNYLQNGNKYDVMLAAGAIMLKYDYAKKVKGDLLSNPNPWFNAIVAYKGVSKEGLRKANLVWNLYKNGVHPYTSGIQLFNPVSK
jgi:RHS repeat-associated protein